jgi:hypothetical protein
VNKSDRGRTCRACHETHAGPQPLHVRQSVPYGNWQMPVNFKRTETGGSCAPGLPQGIFLRSGQSRFAAANDTERTDRANRAGNSRGHATRDRGRSEGETVMKSIRLLATLTLFLCASLTRAENVNWSAPDISGKTCHRSSSG